MPMFFELLDQYYRQKVPTEPHVSFDVYHDCTYAGRMLSRHIVLASIYLKDHADYVLTPLHILNILCPRVFVNLNANYPSHIRKRQASYCCKHN